MQKHIATLAAMRIALGAIFLWAFLDKVFGLGFSTVADKSWLAGTSPTSGFLTYAAKGPFADLFHALSGSAIVDWLFMLGLLGIGIGLLFGIAMRCAVHCGVILLALMYLALLPPEHHPILDEHLIYILALLSIASAPESASVWGFGNRWNKGAIAKRWAWLRS